MILYGIDTSIFVRLLTGDPLRDYEKTKEALIELLKREPTAEITVSNIVIAEAYFVLQHHYSVSKQDARIALTSVMSSGLIRPMQGDEVLKALAKAGEPGVLDHLIAIDYSKANARTFTHDRKMAQLKGCELLLS